MIVALLIVAVTAGLVAAWMWQRPAGHRVGVETPFRNARPGVEYVGDAACARCHEEIAATYRQHSMGRSLIPIGAAPAEVRGEGALRTLFEAQGFRYSIERQGERTLHREERRDGQGRVIGQVEGEVRYVLGSGSRAMAFLIDRDGYLFESPITWYAQGGRWDLAPGYEGKNAHFERPITAECLFCHANQVDRVAGTLNRYRPPIFRGHAIGCERCHGPGELHVRQPSVPSNAEPNIVNPRNLEPALREGVCQQCHLMGESSITELADRDLFDYRPGLPLYRYETVFVQPPGRDHKNSGHVEEMYQSACFRASRGALGCISCHDPHELPAPEKKVAYYRDRCLECHTQRGCSLPAATRLAQSAADNCIECHMPRAEVSNVPHVALSVHSIPRHRQSGAAASSGREPPRSDETLPVLFHGDLMSPAERAEAERDLGVALHIRGERGAASALPMLEEALAAHPEDTSAREAEGYALGALGRGADALAAYEMVLARTPDRESALVGAAIAADRAGRRDQSVAYWRRAIAVDPWPSVYDAGLARQLSQGRRWRDAAEACRNALRHNPANLQARLDLVQCLFRMGVAQEARKELETLLEFDPANRDALVQWFDSLRQR
jgi:Flp pilus assembly protein TadD